MLKNGRLFSPLERQRLLGAMAEGAQFRGGAELDFDKMIEEKVLLAAFPLHTPERLALTAAWLGLRLGGGGWPHGWPYRATYAEAAGKWPLPEEAHREPRRMFPDLAVAQQPLDAIRSYFGAKVAFYFAWAETYTLWLFCIM